MSNEQLKKLAKELVKKIKKNLSIDWTKHESVKAKIRASVKRVLRVYDISPVKYPDTVNFIMKQAEALYANWPSIEASFSVEPALDFYSFPSF